MHAPAPVGGGSTDEHRLGRPDHRGGDGGGRRRHAGRASPAHPKGGYFTDSDRAAGIFGVLATGFSVLLGFLIFLAFESYDASRAGAETEALTVAQQIQTAQFLPADVGGELTGELVCYARSVIHGEWDRMENGIARRGHQPVGRGDVRDAATASSSTSPQQEAAYGKWLDQTSDREAARQDRIHGAAGLMPVPLWIGLFFISAIVLAFLFGFADSGERVWVQAMFMGSVVAVITTMLLLLHFLDDPYHGGLGGLQPTAMERTEQLIDQQLAVIGGDVDDPLRRQRCRGVTDDRDRWCASAAPQRDWIEIVATVLLALAAVATAWSSYQVDAVERGDDQGRRPGQRVAHRRGARPGPGPGPDPGRHRDVHPMGQRLRPRRSRARRLLQRPLPRPSSARPSTPGWPPTRSPTRTRRRPRSPWTSTRSLHKSRPTSYDAEAEASPPSVRVDIQRAANYVLGVVLFAVALFFAGMSTKLTGVGARTALARRRLRSVHRDGGVDRHLPCEHRGVDDCVATSTGSDHAESATDIDRHRPRRRDATPSLRYTAARAT